MTAPRPALGALADRLVEFDGESLENIVRARLLREPEEVLPRLGRDEDPADILVDLAEWLRERDYAWTQLSDASARLADGWADAYQVRTRPEPLGELHYLCARIGAAKARHGIARVIRREDLRGILLPAGEGLQLRALRCLAGLLAHVPRDEREEFLPLFTEALDVPQHLPIALTALVAFDPDGREGYVARIGESWPMHLEPVLDHLERNVALLQAEIEIQVPQR
jgi:hypothetical protein